MIAAEKKRQATKQTHKQETTARHQQLRLREHKHEGTHTVGDVDRPAGARDQAAEAAPDILRADAGLEVVTEHLHKTEAIGTDNQEQHGEDRSTKITRANRVTKQ